MKNKLALALLFLLPVGFSTANAERTPEDLIKLYFEAFKNGDHELLAANMDTNELQKLKTEMLPIVARGIDAAASGASKDELAMKLFADTESIDVITKESPKDFFIRFMNWLNRINPMMKSAMANANYEIVGHVAEGDLAHVVYRMTLNVSGARVTQMNVKTVKRDGENWMLMLSNEIEGLGKLLQRDAPKF